MAVQSEIDAAIAEYTSDSQQEASSALNKMFASSNFYSHLAKESKDLQALSLGYKARILHDYNEDLTEMLQSGVKPIVDIEREVDFSYNLLLALMKDIGRHHELAQNELFSISKRVAHASQGLSYEPKLRECIDTIVMFGEENMVMDAHKAGRTLSNYVHELTQIAFPKNNILIQESTFFPHEL